jgi:hypothetical protein
MAVRVPCQGYKANTKQRSRRYGTKGRARPDKDSAPKRDGKMRLRMTLLLDTVWMVASISLDHQLANLPKGQNTTPAMKS